MPEEHGMDTKAAIGGRRNTAFRGMDETEKEPPIGYRGEYAVGIKKGEIWNISGTIERGRSKNARFGEC